jgi:ABC-2 type transport system ATP-binding protein
MEPAVEVSTVYKSFKSVQAVCGVSFSIEKSRSIALLGPNGAGKTTLVEMIEGIQAPDSGEIRILGRHWKGNEDLLHRSIGLSLQETRFIDKLTVYETVRLFASFYDLDKSRVGEILETVGLTDKQGANTANLSGGQRQRLALGLSLINRPKILLLDEPTTGLDPNARREIWSILADLRQNSQTSLILTTHYMEEAEQLCDYILIMDRGRVLKEGTLEALLEDEDGEKVIEFTVAADGDRGPAEAVQALRGAPFQIRWHTENGRASLRVSDLNRELPGFFDFLSRQQVHLKSMECRRKTLDDLFTEMTGRRLDA